MTQKRPSTTWKSPDPDPLETPGLQEGGQVPQGDTPPAEGSTPDAGPPDPPIPNRGWEISSLVFLTILIASFAVFFLAWAFEVW
ncbi:hypothetical protein E0L36_13720 [Streptomyces sp. AJS327]|uniref:DUF6480 family protein n=1 Tax=Streptomyces sp. AJS327 TaxID=2545265 RepID=UPI0015DE433E|nr:DUF6480 family protein [Streptomyces sp. AJS327]MBA0051913.1 hypothetical protein [Streptomyces sp. AJS327]